MEELGDGGEDDDERERWRLSLLKSLRRWACSLRVTLSFDLVWVLMTSRRTVVLALIDLMSQILGFLIMRRF